MATYDILIFQGVKAIGEQQVDLSLGNPGYFATGIQKAAQSFAKLFLTELGSMPNDPTAGTSFLSDLRSGTIRDELTLQASYQSAVVDVLNYMSENEDLDLPDDEALEEANLLSWDMRPGFLSITVQIVTAAGESRTYVVPVETRKAS
jgi:hypothetical protein